MTLEFMLQTPVAEPASSSPELSPQPSIESPIMFLPEALSESERRLHETAMAKATRYLETEAELLHVIMEIDRSKLFHKFSLGSTFAYCLRHLRLSEAVAYNFINVARKARTVPELKAVIDRGDLTVSKARKIVPVLTNQNCAEWIEKAVTLPQAKLEREVAEHFPEAAARLGERTKPAKGGRIRLEITLSEEVMRKLRRTQELISEKRKHQVDLETALTEVLENYLTRHDPQQKADRALSRKKALTGPQDRPRDSSQQRPQAAATGLRDLSRDKPGRQHIPADVRHAVTRRDRGRCRARLAGGSICGSTRFLNFHHLVPVARGGIDSVENLITLCGACHRRWHRHDHWFSDGSRRQQRSQTALRR